MKPKTNAQKRVVIARDVVKQLDAKKIIAEAGVYLSVPIPRLTRINQEILSGPASPVCRVCALGALFISRIRLFDAFDGTTTSLDRFDLICSLQRIFGERRLDTIENFFERDADDDRFNDLQDETRLRFICQFIIRSKGEFDTKAADKSAERFARTTARK